MSHLFVVSLLNDLLVLTPKLVGSLGSKRQPLITEIALIASQDLFKPYILKLRT